MLLWLQKKGTQPTSSQSTAKIGFKSSTVATDHSAALGHPNITSGTSSQLNYLHKVQHLASNAAVSRLAGFDQNVTDSRIKLWFCHFN